MSNCAKEIDKTIISVCGLIQGEIKGGLKSRTLDDLPGMVIALAALVDARAVIDD